MKKIIKLLLMTVPIICFALAIYLLTDFAYNRLLETNSVFNLLISSSDTLSREGDDLLDGNIDEDFIIPEEEPDSIIYSGELFPTVIKHGSKWAVLNIENWKMKDIPVYFGDSDVILSMGAGQWNGSYFCGLEKNCVLSAHVMTWFYEVEDTEIGDEVTMQTIYGTYKYEVSDKFIFNETDASVLWNDYGGDTLFIYTCYPRTSGFFRTHQRIALVCSLKEGIIYESKYE